VAGTLFLRELYAPKRQVEAFYNRYEILNQKYQSRKIDGSEYAERQIYLKIAPILSVHWDMLKAAKKEEERKNIYNNMKNLLTVAENASKGLKRKAQ
jgi:hypothetical protein